MSFDVSTELHSALDTKIKIRPGSTVTLSEELQIPSGVYIVYIEHERKDSSVRKSHTSISASGDLLITAEGESEVLKSEVDFHREHPFLREITVTDSVIEDGASDVKDEHPTIKVLFTVVSTAHLKKIRLRFKFLTKNESAHAVVINSNITEKRKNGRVRLISSNAPNPDSDKSTPTNSYTDLPQVTGLDIPPPPPSSSSSSSSSSTATSSSLAVTPVLTRTRALSGTPLMSRTPGTPIMSKGTPILNRNTPLNRNKIIMEDEDYIDAPRSEKRKSCEKHNTEVCEKDILVIQKNTTFSSEGVEQANSTQIHMEHTKTVTESTTTTDSKSDLSSEKSIRSSADRSSNPSEKTNSTDISETTSSSSSSSFDPSEENLVYYKEIKLRKKHVLTEKIPIQQKGKYYLVIENMDKGPINRHFSCHAVLSQGETLLKESFTNDAKKKLSDDFTVDTDSADLTLEIVHTNSSFGKSELQVSLYMKNAANDEATATKPVHPHFRTGEVVWAVSACEVEKKKPQSFTAKIPTSGKYYIVVEKVDKIYGGLREISVNATLTQPPKEGTDVGRVSKVASVVVGGVKARPMKWKSQIFVAPAGSVVDFTVESYALVGSIIYSLRLRKVPGLTAEEERTRQMVLLFLITFGIYYLLYLALSVLHFIQNIGFTFNFLFLSIDITIGRICFILCAVWFHTNQEILVPCMKDVSETVRKIVRKIKYIRDMSDGGKFDILRIFKQMSKEGKMNDLRKWERQKLQTANE